MKHFKLFALLAASCVAATITPLSVQGATKEGVTFSAARLPLAKSPTYPEYPAEMRGKRQHGKVTVQFDVETDGQIVNLAVYDSTHHSFDAAVLEAVAKWTFEPGTTGLAQGLPVKMKLQQTFTFDAKDAVSHEPPQLIPPPREATGKFFIRDVTPSAKRVVLPVYPYALLHDQVKGDAYVRYLVNEAGFVDGNDVLAASHPEFGLALTAALEATEFTPGSSAKGEPTRTFFKTDRKFRPEGFKGVPGPADLAMLEREKKHPETILTPKQLDRPLKPIAQQAPVFPFFNTDKIESGKAIVEFIVDEVGLVTLPRIVEASKPAFGYAAIQAIAAWRFESPQAEGKAAAVRVRVPFKFEHENPSPHPAVAGDKTTAK